jgi:hypothetical protein
MNFFKILLAILLLLLAVAGAFFLFGLLAGLVKLLLWIGIIALVVGVAVKLFSKGEREPGQLEEAGMGLDETDRLLAEYRSKKLLK